MIPCRAREKTNIWRPWHQELRKRLRWIGILVNWGCFLQNYELLLGQYSKISNQGNFLEKDTNFCWIFYLMPALHKKSRQSLRSSTGRIGWDFFSKIDILSAKVCTKKVLNFEIVWPTLGTLRPLTIKGVYLVSHSLVCASFLDGVYVKPPRGNNCIFEFWSQHDRLMISFTNDSSIKLGLTQLTMYRREQYFTHPISKALHWLTWMAEFWAGQGWSFIPTSR